MQIDRLGANETVIYHSLYTVLYSYDTPVVLYDVKEGLYLKTETFHSVTTSKHINKYLRGIPEGRVKLVPQGAINNLVNLM